MFTHWYKSYQSAEFLNVASSFIDRLFHELLEHSRSFMVLTPSRAAGGSCEPSLRTCRPSHTSRLLRRRFVTAFWYTYTCITWVICVGWPPVRFGRLVASSSVCCRRFGTREGCRWLVRVRGAWRSCSRRRRLIFYCFVLLPFLGVWVLLLLVVVFITSLGARPYIFIIIFM